MPDFKLPYDPVIQNGLTPGEIMQRAFINYDYTIEWVARAMVETVEKDRGDHGSSLPPYRGKGEETGR